MKKLLFALVLGLFAGTVAAQENYFFPASGKVNRYKAEVSTPMGNQSLYSSVYVKDQNAEGYTVSSDVFQNEGDASPLQSVVMTYKNGDGNLLVDFKELLGSNLAALGDVKVTEISGDVVYPKNPKVGETYPEVTMKISGNVQGVDLSMDLAMKDRKISEQETIEVPAGKFDCLKYEERTVVSVMGQEQVTVSTSWLAAGVGMVKQKTEAMNGMMTTVMELVSVKDK